jgi:DNA-binding PadR family transcriptional regulator
MLIKKYWEIDFTPIFEEFFSKPKKIILRALILAQLGQQESHGYSIMKKIEKNTQGKWKPSNSMIYGELSELEKKEMITSKENQKGELTLKLYNITEKGREELEKLSYALIKLFDFKEIEKGAGYPVIESLVSGALDSLNMLSKDEQIERLKEMRTLVDTISNYLNNRLDELEE